ncbi:hypothetical protein SPF06_02580 [Sinomonas sp. JGH33]|uniref:WXG100 family type VII secretion target n=1 Tax=Sinomonas terricola TaxID=3110330 RepID=A0ABU5T1Q3_9MICC|nr:hypothetical protein [Sinomonas sp. JGH33]MEA5453598.1 hypothetical protein [Sinomonas sp. JGH33]
MAIRSGANVEELRALAMQFGKAAQNVDRQGQQLTALLPRPDVWAGSDAEEFRQRWHRQHGPALKALSQRLDEASKTLYSNAAAQEAASEGSTGAIGGSPVGPGGGPGTPAGPGGAPSDLSILNDIFDTGKDAKKVGSALWSAISYSINAEKWAQGKELFQDWASVGSHLRDGVNSLRSGDSLSEAFQSVRSGIPYAQAFEDAGKFSQGLRWAGALAAPFAIVGGIHDAISPSHDGLRGVGDRVAGGLSVVGGVGSIMLATAGGAAMLGPIGAPVVIGAGLVAAGWALGNAIYDHWGSITHFAGDVTGTITGAASEVASGVSHAVSGAAHSVVSGISSAAKSATNFIGGIFG